MKKVKTYVLILVGLVLASILVMGLSYYISYYYDVYTRPWAHSHDTNEPLLVGKWEGSFTDPGGVKKQIVLEIFKPKTEEVSWAKAGRKSSKNSFSDRQGFGGRATVMSRIGQEEYEIYGAVQKEDYHQMYFNFRSQNDDKQILPNFTLLEAKEGHWKNNKLKTSLDFEFHKADGTRFWDSSDPRFNKVVNITLTRVKN